MKSYDQIESAANKKMDYIFFRFKFLTGRHHLLWYILPVLIITFFLYRYIKTDYNHLLPSLRHFLIPGFFSFLLMIFVTPSAIILARKMKIVKKPEYPKHNIEEMPLLGGAAIYLVVLTISIFHLPWPKEIISIFAGALIILIIGTIDDIYPLSSTVRLFGQLSASLIVMSSGLIVSFMPDTSWGLAVASIITVIWILGIVNAANFADGVDGLTAGMTAIACVFFFLITLVSKQFHLTLLSSVLSGCCFGFLIFNFKPAKIYLGDGGSTTLGFFLACFALYGGWSSKGPVVALGIPVLILGVLIFDMTYITLSRIKGKKVRNFKQWLDYRARDHFHHRLINIGLKEAQAVIFIYIICIILGLSALALENTRYSFPVIILVVQAALMFTIITILMLVGRELTD